MIDGMEHVGDPTPIAEDEEQAAADAAYEAQDAASGIDPENPPADVDVVDLAKRVDGMESSLGQILDILKSKQAPEVHTKEFQDSFDPAEAMEHEHLLLQNDGTSALSDGGYYDGLDGVSQEDLNKAINGPVLAQFPVGDGNEGKADIFCEHNGNKWLLQRNRPVKIPLYIALMLTESWVAEYSDLGDTGNKEKLKDTYINIHSMDILRRVKYSVALLKATALQHRLLKRSMNTMPRMQDTIRVSSGAM